MHEIFICPKPSNNPLGRVMTIENSIITQDLNTVPIIIKIRLKIGKVPTRGQYLR